MMLALYEPGIFEAILSLLTMLFMLAIPAAILFFVFRILWLIIKHLEKGLKK